MPVVLYLLLLCVVGTGAVPPKPRETLFASQPKPGPESEPSDQSEPEESSWLFSATGLFTGLPRQQNGHMWFHLTEARNVIGFTDRPSRDAKSLTLTQIARLFEAPDEVINPPNGIVTVKTTLNETVSIAVLISAHDHLTEPDEMAFQYELIGEVEVDMIRNAMK